LYDDKQKMLYASFVAKFGSSLAIAGQLYESTELHYCSSSFIAAIVFFSLPTKILLSIIYI